MPLQVCTGAKMTCSFGAAPAVFAATQTTVITNQMPCGVITDIVPIKNIPTFGMCSAPTNPAVMAATSAALGVFTPAPCVPAPASPWAPGASNVIITNIPALDNVSKTACTWLGVISFVDAGQTNHPIP